MSTEGRYIVMDDQDDVIAARFGTFEECQSWIEGRTVDSIYYIVTDTDEWLTEPTVWDELNLTREQREEFKRYRIAGWHGERG